MRENELVLAPFGSSFQYKLPSLTALNLEWGQGSDFSNANGVCDKSLHRTYPNHLHNRKFLRP